ncbi:MAG TPA: DUF1800 family protein [Ilumatobacter sp.]|nr:DUF1800 family protein [Ilumatobacter sp.]
MPSPDEVTHLLRRTEFFAAPARVAELAAMPTRAAAVADVLDVARNGGPPPLRMTAPDHPTRIAEVTRSWIDQMLTSQRRIQEKMALFWHGHFVSDDAKAGNTQVIKQQLDLYRAKGLGNLRELAIEMSTTVAMLRYLDNNENFAEAPNQNFGRELMELFLLGVGNYTEADVEASTAAWTGHSVTNHADNTGTYWWRPDRHDPTPMPFLGQMTCQHADPKRHGADAIRTILSNGVATAGSRAGQPTREIAADFISTKLWAFFAGTTIPSAVRTHLRGVALGSNFDLTPWVRALLLRDEFYTSGVRRGLVRSPVDYLVALLATTSVPADPAFPFWLGEGMGQRLLFPPNVAGWGYNGYYVNASAFAQRAAAARHVAYYVLADYWDGAGMRLRRGWLTRAEVWASGNDSAARRGLVRQLTELMGITLGSTTLAALDEFAVNAKLDEFHDLVELIYVSPEMTVA